ncbi:SurA N-terminal domain-containing protein [Malikia granosa]|uniref:Periplasmic chaperone PpiD n=1 Tax=Malikia granosa TaxID=263067 RepID=A0A2S9K6P4_9BURK|nr:SurA N-terminal domain-containing protein [Malikia granosa]PRD66055.1 peptidylprolyl isomerase [Malikia granosa]
MFDFFRKHMKLFMGLLFIPLVIGFVLFGVQGYDRSGGADKVAEVAGKAITRQELDNAHRSEVEQRLASMPGLDRAQLESDAARRLTLDRLIGQRVLALAAKDQHVVTSDQRLVRELSQDPAIASLRKPDGQLDLQRYNEALRAQGMTPEQYENSLRQDLAQRQVLAGISASSLLPAALAQPALAAWFERREVQIARFVPADFVAKVQVGDADVESYYQANLARFQTPEQADIEYLVLDLDAVARRLTVSDADLRARYEQKLAQLAKDEQRRASHILLTVAPDAAAADKAKVKEQAQALLAELKQKPARFAELAKARSQDPGSAAKGGDLEFFSRGSMVKPFEDAAFALAKGQISDLVESEFGFHIIQLTDIRQPAKPSFESLRAELERELKQQQSLKAYVEAAEQFGNLVYEQADSLKPAADKLGLSIKTQAGLQRSGPTAAGADALLANPKLLQAVFADDALRSKRNTEAVEVGPNQLVAARVLQHRPAATRPLAEVSAQVRQALVQQRALELAQADGKAKLEAWKGGAAASLPAAIVVSRQQAQGLPQPLVSALLSAPVAKGQPGWAGVDLGPQGYAVARVNQVLAPETLPAPQAEQGRQQLAQMWAQAEAQAYLEALKKHYKVKILIKS